MLKYGKDPIFDVDSRDPLNVDRLSLGLIPKNVHVLDIGCATGFMGKYLQKNKKCIVDGIEMSSAEYQIAKKTLRYVVKGNAEDPETYKKLAKKLKSAQYDVILASAILEHLVNPDKVLKILKKFLKKDGYIIATTPNVAHWSMRLHLLRGKFEYEEYGIRDKTHLKFFTIDSFKELFTSAGYTIEEFLIDPVGGGFPRLGRIGYQLLPGVFGYQMVIKARPL